MATAKNHINAQLIIMTSPESMEFAELYECHYATVYRAAFHVTGNAADAEDVLQTVFLRILNREERSNWGQLSEAYFRRAAINAAIDILRRRISHAEVRLEETPSPLSAESPAFLKERLRHAIANLEQNDAILFLLRYVEGLSNGELSEMFGQDKNNIAVRLHRIRQTLQSEMKH